MRVRVYSMAGCPSCSEVKEFLADFNIPFELIEINDRAEREKLYDLFGLQGGERTMPQVVVLEDGPVPTSERIGGLEKTLASGIAGRYRRALAAQAAA